MFLQFFKILKAAKREQNLIESYLSNNKEIVGIISDNRFGVYSNKVSSVYITHQLCVLSGVFTFFTSFFHQRIIKKFDECWIPDTINSSLSGKLSITKNEHLNVNYIGVLSRLKSENLSVKWDITILLSGPEPNRTKLETKLICQFKDTTKKIVLIQGKVSKKQIWTKKDNLQIVNFMLTKELEFTLNSSKLIVARSGYSTIMDVSVLEKEVLLIPTKGQREQEYLAKFLQTNYKVKSIEEREVKMFDFNSVTSKPIPKNKVDLEDNLFSLFQRK